MMQLKPLIPPGSGMSLGPVSVNPAATSVCSVDVKTLQASRSPAHKIIETVPVKSLTILKQPITPMNGKTNLLNLLKHHKNGKSEIFKTIGNRIVIPMKVCVSAKKLAEKEASNILPIGNKASTFQMAVPFNRAQLPGLSNGRSPGKTSPFKISRTLLKPVSTQVFPIKQEINSNAKTSPRNETSDYGDLNKFMTSVSNNLRFVPRTDDQDSVTSSTDSNKLNSSLSSMSKFSDFDELEDNDLTCLSWLSSNNKDLFNTIRKCNPDDPGIGMSGDETDNDENQDNKLFFTASSRINGQNQSPNIADDFKYNPMNKPPYSFSCLIFMAIEDSYLKRLPVKEIYTWVCKHFPYFRTAPSGWKNSIRHNLSLNRCFKKAECRRDSVKGSLWCIDPAYRPNLVQALKRSPFYPYLHPTGIGQPLSLNNLANLLPGVHTGRVPSWSPTLPPSTTLWADPDMASAALNLMGLRGNDEGSTKRSESISNTLEEIFRDAEFALKGHRQRCNSTESVGTEQLVISGCSQDHNYTVVPPTKKKSKREDTRCRSPESDKSAPDAAYEFETVGFSEDDLDDDIIDDIMDDVVIDGEESDGESQSLFDSGFGSMKSFQTKSPLKRKSSKSDNDKKSSSAKRRKMNNSERNGKKSRYTSKKSAVHTKSTLKNVKSATNSRKIKVRINKPDIGISLKKSKKTIEKKNSDVDSGKDSPVANRLSRSKRMRQRSFRKSNNSNYHTRSSGHTLIGQDSDDKRKGRYSRRCKRLISNRLDAAEEDEEIKLAAGSLLRLAGLIKSPVSSTRGNNK